ncbi:MAG: PilZ domain-containing protein [Terriglobales bacterium]
MTEARTGKRFPLRLPITVRKPKSLRKHKGATSDVSAGGAYFSADADFEVGAIIEFAITLPHRALGTSKDVELRCSGRVVRAETASAARKGKKKRGRKGLACIIDQYKFVRKR